MAPGGRAEDMAQRADLVATGRLLAVVAAEKRPALGHPVASVCGAQQGLLGNAGLAVAVLG